jgi:tetratricopeptide (TPR) repeat protein
MRWAIRWTLGAALLSAPLAGCESGDGAVIAEGRKALRANDYVAAHAKFDEALKADPESYDALWGKAEAFRGEAKLGDQQKVLEKIMSIPKLAETYAGVVKPALEDNYRKQAETIMGTSPEQAEAFLRKAIDLNKKSEANITLAELLSRSGDALLKKAKYKEAAEKFDEALKLRIARKMRGQITGKKEIADFMAFKAELMPRFEKVKGDLVEAKVYDDKTKTFFVTAEAVIEGSPKDDEKFEANAERAGLVAVTQALNDLSWKVAGKERPEGASVAYSKDVVSVVAKSLDKRGKEHVFTYRVSLPADAVFEKVLEIDQDKFEKAPPPAGDGGAAAAAPADAGAQ